MTTVAHQDVVEPQNRLARYIQYKLALRLFRRNYRDHIARMVAGTYLDDHHRTVHMPRRDQLTATATDTKVALPKHLDLIEAMRMLEQQILRVFTTERDFAVESVEVKLFHDRSTTVDERYELMLIVYRKR